MKQLAMLIESQSLLNQVSVSELCFKGDGLHISRESRNPFLIRSLFPSDIDAGLYQIFDVESQSLLNQVSVSEKRYKSIF